MPSSTRIVLTAFWSLLAMFVPPADVTWAQENPVEALSGLTGQQRLSALRSLGNNGRLANDYTPADFNAIVSGMEAYRLEAIDVLVHRFRTPLGAADFVQIAGGLRDQNRLTALRLLGNNGRLGDEYTPDDFDAIVSGMESQRLQALDALIHRFRKPLSSADFAQLAVSLRDQSRLTALRLLDNNGRLDRGYTPDDFDTIVNGMEAQRLEALSVLSHRFEDDLGAAQVGRLLGNLTGSSRESGFRTLANNGRTAPRLTLAQVPLVASVAQSVPGATASTPVPGPSPPPAPPPPVCAVAQVAQHMSIPSPSCEQIWRYHVMRHVLIPYVSRQREIIDQQIQSIELAQTVAQRTARVLELMQAFVAGLAGIVDEDTPDAIRMLEVAVSADSIVEVVTGMTDESDCAPDFLEAIKTLGVAAILDTTPADYLPVQLRAAGCVATLIGIRTQVLPARNSLVVAQDVLVAYYRNGGDVRLAARELGVQASSVSALIGDVARLRRSRPFNPIATRRVVSGFIRLIDRTAGECLLHGFCSPR